MASASPRTLATSLAGSSWAGGGSRASVPNSPCCPGANDTVRSSRSAIARMAQPVTRLNSSMRVSRSVIVQQPAVSAASHQHRLAAQLQLRPHAALVVFGHDRPLQLVALVEEGHLEAEGDVVEDA